MTKFEVNKTYHTGFDADGKLNLRLKYRVIRRTPKYIFVVKLGQKELQKLKVKINIDNEEYVKPSKDFPFYLHSGLEVEKVKNRHKFEVGKFYYLVDSRWSKALPITARMIKILSIDINHVAKVAEYSNAAIFYEPPTQTGAIKISLDGSSEYIRLGHEEYYASLLVPED